MANRSVASQYPFDPVGARHVGMGAASAAMWMGPEAIYHNPASLVWQTLTMGAGIQPVQFVDTPASWWVHFYNKETAYGVPAALVAQGWDYTAPDGDNGHYLDLGLPVAFNFTDSTPGAATIHFAFEKRGDGKWEFEMPLDFGFLARHPSGATLGIVARGVTIGNNGLESVRERIEYGASYGAGGLLVLSTSVLWYKGDDWETVKDRYRIGGEFGGESKIHVLGGYIHEPDNWFYTGGIVLRSDETGRFEFIYSVIYDHNREFFGHFIQYGVRWY
ncbi:MAG TPA: hypothetical protein ENH10_03275 [Bacteroidetes bacterium]|nr:hypothetical protein [Bacteroidota bacterium]HEX04163.1 hypothetical protein [Bacteroidota bacterium]